MGDLTQDIQDILNRFENAASSLCDQAKVDYEDRASFVRQWTIRLVELFERSQRQGHGNVRAAEDALRRWGNPKAIARTLRGGMGGFIERLLTFRRYQTARLICVTLAFQLEQYVDLQYSLFILDPDILLAYGTNIFAGSVICAAALGAGRKERYDDWLVRPVCLVVAWGIYLYGFYLYLRSFGNYSNNWRGRPVDWFLTGFVTITLPVVLLSFLCLWSECFEWPKKFRERKAMQQKIFAP